MNGWRRVALALLLGCTGEAASPAGAQLVAARDIGPLGLWEHRWLYGRASGGGRSTERDLWSVASDGSTPTRLVERWTSRTGWPEPWEPWQMRGGRLFVWRQPADQPIELLAFDDPTAPLGPHALVPESVTIREDGGAIAGQAGFNGPLLLGPPSDLSPARLQRSGVPDRGIDAVWVDWVGRDAVSVGRSEPPEGSAESPAIYRVDAATRVASVLVPPAISTPCLDREYCPSLLAVGCALDTPPCLDGKPPRCVVAYARRAASGMTHPYVWDQATATEVRLPDESMSPPEGFFGSPDGHTLVWHDPTPLEGDDNRVWFLDTCSGEIDRCRVFAGQNMKLRFRDDGKAFAVSLDEPGGAVSVDLESRPRKCSGFGLTRRIGHFEFSPDSRRMAWIDRSGPPESLWFGDGLGFVRTKLADGDFVPSFQFSPDGSRVFVGRTADRQVSLSWFGLDPYADSNPEHPLTPSHRQALPGSRRALVIAEYNTQEQTGDLVLFDLATGARTLLARAVSAFEADGDVDGLAEVAYAVHGRYPSCRDGLWVVTLPP